VSGSQRTADEANSVQFIGCRICHVAVGERCRSLATRQLIKHPHSERVEDWRELRTDQGASWIRPIAGPAN